MPALHLSLSALALLLLTACPSHVKDTAPGQESAATQKFQSQLKALHHAAQEMALDGFQYNKHRLGWPFEAKVQSSSDYLRLLVSEGYLAPEVAESLKNVAIANVSDSDPLTTLFLSVPTDDGKTLIVRKDGNLQSEQNLESSKTFAPPPPREPVWLEPAFQAERN